MFRKPFNYKDGEIRNCNNCNTEFKTFRPIFRCGKCQSEKVKELRKKKYEEGKLILKATYPYVNHKKEYSVRFKKLQSRLNKIKIRSEWQKYLKEKLDEILNDEVLMLWINDRRDKETLESNKVKSKSKTNKDYPSTIGHHED
jgi:hypothetical protein